MYCDHSVKGTPHLVHERYCPLVLESPVMNERQQAHIQFYLQRLEYWKDRKPASSTARLLAARDADEAHPLRTEEEATEVVEYLWRLERGQTAE